MTMDSATVDSEDLLRLSQLAQSLNAELETVFVEDLEVLRVAELPFLREFRFASMRFESFDQQSLEAELRVVARRAEQALAGQTALRDVRWRFRVWRGSLEPERLATLDADVLALHRPGTKSSRNGSQFSQRSIAVCFDGSVTANRALAMASALAMQAQLPLTVILVGERESLEDLQAQAEGAMASPAPQLSFEPLREATQASLVMSARRAGRHGLVVARDSPLLRDGSLRDLLHALGGPLFLVS
jgi:hypothetical protein